MDLMMQRNLFGSPVLWKPGMLGAKFAGAVQKGALQEKTLPVFLARGMAGGNL